MIVLKRLNAKSPHLTGERIGKCLTFFVILTFSFLATLCTAQSQTCRIALAEPPYIALGFYGLRDFASYGMGNCVKFSGKYLIGSAGCFESHDGGTYFDYLYTGLTVSAQTTNDNLSMFYQTGRNDGFTANYVADGLEHTGNDNNSGKTYTAQCDENQIKTIRVGMFIAPMSMTFARNSDGSYTLTESINGAHPYSHSCQMFRAT
jgi:hypothetical protein